MVRTCSHCGQPDEADGGTNGKLDTIYRKVLCERCWQIYKARRRRMMHVLDMLADEDDDFVAELQHRLAQPDTSYVAWDD